MAIDQNTAVNIETVQYEILKNDLTKAKKYFIRLLTESTGNSLNRVSKEINRIRETWHLQERTARTYVSGDRTQSVIDILTAIKTGTETIDEIADKIVLRADYLNNKTAAIIGASRKHIKYVENLPPETAFVELETYFKMADKELLILQNG